MEKIKRIIDTFNEFCGDSEDTILDEVLQFITLGLIIYAMVAISIWL